jgi:hypothetical protein
MLVFLLSEYKFNYTPINSVTFTAPGITKRIIMKWVFVDMSDTNQIISSSYSLKQEGEEAMVSHRKITYSIKYSNTSLYKKYIYEFFA